MIEYILSAMMLSVKVFIGGTAWGLLGIAIVLIVGGIIAALDR